MTIRRDRTFEERYLRGPRPQVLQESRDLTKVLDQSRSTAKKRQALRDYRDQILRDERLGDKAVPNYIVVDSGSPAVVDRKRFRPGWNIIGVRTSGFMVVRLPITLRRNQMVSIKDERGTAGVDNIRVDLYDPSVTSPTV